jgi:hypothetical protein
MRVDLYASIYGNLTRIDYPLRPPDPPLVDPPDPPLADPPDNDPTNTDTPPPPEPNDFHIY